MKFYEIASCYWAIVYIPSFGFEKLEMEFHLKSITNFY